MEEAAKHLSGVEWCSDSYSAIEGADVLLLITEWNEFRALDLPRVKGLLKRPLVVDLRNVYRPSEMVAAGFEYHSIGRPGRALAAAVAEDGQGELAAR
jgi:UDPglucose 6-dehydrogenase